MKLPFLISLPNCGVMIPEAVRAYCALGNADIVADGAFIDWEIYSPLSEEVAAFLSADFPRLIVDLNRAEDDFSFDGVIKSHTSLDVPIYRQRPSGELVQLLLEQVYRSYHNQLSHLAQGSVLLGINCITQPATKSLMRTESGHCAPQVSIDTVTRGQPREWLDVLKTCFEAHFPGEVRLGNTIGNDFIIRRHGQELPWVQLVISRGAYASNAEKAMWVLESLTAMMELRDFQKISAPSG